MEGLYLEHHGILGQKWGVRRYQNEDGTLTSAGKVHYAKQEYKEAKKEYSKNFNKAYDYSSRHPISQNFGYHKKRSDELWDKAYDSRKQVSEKRNNYKNEKQEYHNTDEYKQKRNKAIKVGAAVVGTAAVVAGTAYVAYKLDKKISTGISKEHEDLGRYYMKDAEFLRKQASELYKKSETYGEAHKKMRSADISVRIANDAYKRANRAYSAKEKADYIRRTIKRR